MENITPAQHHHEEMLWAVDTNAEGTVYYNLVVYASASGESGNLAVEQGYGRLTVLKFRNK
jgi:hypothetical protein